MRQKMSKHLFPVFLVYFVYLGGQFADGINFLTRNTCTTLGGYTFVTLFGDCKRDPLVLLDVPFMIKLNGYTIETHIVETPDGYFLSLFRIPPKKKGAPPVFLQHGALFNSACFVDKVHQSHAYAYADAGYDVWLGNVRGTTYSKGHRYLKPADPEYWDFNLDTIAQNDIPASLQFIADYTGQAGNIAYVGHSQGTTLFFMFAASMPEKAQKLVKGMVALSPVAYLSNHKFLHATSSLSGVSRTVHRMLTITGLYTHESFMHPITVHVCRDFPHVCKGLLRVLYGADDDQYDPKEHLKFFSNWPVSISLDQAIHFWQIAGRENVQMFDYGKEENKKRYGQEKPPGYNFGKIKIPVYLFYGLNDALCPIEDVQRLFKELGSKDKQMIQISKENVKYNHIAFVHGKNNSELLFPIVLDTFKSKFGLDPSKVPEPSKNECPAPSVPKVKPGSAIILGGGSDEEDSAPSGHPKLSKPSNPSKPPTLSAPPTPPTPPNPTKPKAPQPIKPPQPPKSSNAPQS